MPSLSNLSIKSKLMIICMVTSIFGLTIAAVAFYTYEVRTFRIGLAQQYMALANGIEPISATALTFGDDMYATEILTQLNANPDMLGAAIYDAEGDVFAVARENMPATAEFPPPVEPAGYRFQNFDLLLFEPVIFNDDQIGTIHLYVKLTNARERAINFSVSLVLVVACSLAAALLLSTLLIRYISRPIEELAATTKRVAVDKDYSIRAQKTSDDELGELIDSFNEMLEQIRQRDTALEQHKEKLEEEVAERTQDLRKLSVAVEQSPNVIVITDPEGKVEYVNRRFTDITGFKPEEALNQDPFLMTTGNLTEKERRVVFRSLHRGEEWRGEFTNQRKDGGIFWESATVAPLRSAQGDVTNYVWLKEDITERKRAEEALRESEERYALAARGANDGLWDWDMRKNSTYFSSRWKAMLGYGEDEIGDTPDEWLGRIHPEDREAVQQRIDAHFRGLTSLFEHEFRMEHKNGEYRWMLCRGEAVLDSDGNVYRFAGSQSDITDRKRAEDKLFHDASHDSLTGLPNRSLFSERLGNSIERAKRHTETLFAVLFLDLDRFKIINDSLGHLIGDKLLILVSHRLGDCVRTADTIARLGGDEFAILLDDIESEEDAIMVAERIQQELSLPFNLDEHEVFTSTSIGIALSTQGYERADDLLRDSDSAMYRAKSQGKAQYAMFDSRLHDQAVRRLELENDLRRAIDNSEFVLYYQPIVAINSEDEFSLEALVRWIHPDKGIVSPAEFIPVAEETGLIVPIGWVLLRQACEQAREWHGRYGGEYPIFVNVNISSKQFMQADFTSRFQAIVHETEVPPEILRLEITETVIIENSTSVTNILKDLRALNVQLCIDDFGTGYSSLSYLHQLPFDVVKIDRSFVQNIEALRESRELVQGIVSLCKNLGLKVTAEGVETDVQLEMLRNMQCDYAQGYLIAKPMPAEDIPAFMAANQGRWRLGTSAAR
jgi:diguanylate cyclase (GGDEF)-like protein/PAS domain S-box-containing protein